MGKWRALFESKLPPVEQRQYEEQYLFGLPATAEQLAGVETALGISLPPEVSELLAEFNGLWYTTRASRRNGREPDLLYLDTESVTGEVPTYLRCWGEPPITRSGTDLRKVVFVAQVNGFADLYGVCLEPLAEFHTGSVVRLDHETGELHAAFPDLAALVSYGPR